MNLDKVLKEVLDFKPKVAYLCGKTCTGKTTFTHLLEKEGFARIELDQIVMDSVVVPYNVSPAYEAYVTAYQDVGPPEQVASFTKAAREAIREKLKTTSVVVEGSLGKPRLVKEIFGEDGDFLFLYFHPTDASAYADRIRARFVAGAKNKTSGLPKTFWKMVKEEDLNRFMEAGTLNEGIEESIREYVGLSIQESQKRLSAFKPAFPNLVVVEV